MSEVKNGDELVQTVTANMAENQNPILQVSPQALDELFDKDPLLLTKEDISVAVAAFRQQRMKWKQEEAEGGTKKAAKKVNTAANKSLDVDQLDIKL